MSVTTASYAGTPGLYDSGYYNLAATTALLLWDIMVTLPREKLYVWSYKSKVNWTTLFYIINRYLPFIINVILLSLPRFEASKTIVDCTVVNEGLVACMPTDTAIPSLQLFARTFRTLYTFPWFVVLCCTEILFVRGIIALHDGSRLLPRILIGLLICELLSALFLIFHFTFLEELFTVFDISTVGESKILTIPGFLPDTYFALPEIVFQAFLVMLIIQKVIWDWKSGTERSSLGSILIRDGLWSYFCNLCGLLVVLLQPVWLNGPFNLPNILFEYCEHNRLGRWSYASFSVTSSRLILNIRAAAASRTGATLNGTSGGSGAWTRFTFVQNIRSFLVSTNDELSTPYHYNDFEHNSDSDGDD